MARLGWQALVQAGAGRCIVHLNALHEHHQHHPHPFRCHYLQQGQFKANVLLGLGVYKFLYLRPDLLPNPLFPFIAWRVALPGQHPELAIRRQRLRIEPAVLSSTAEGISP